ncbi:hypothetical protein KAU93_02390 [Candidatus Bathyarchaeota archaeon]|nr:hypothetical protein [Candidatus Bathyarchaeota archaeon]
MRRKAQAFYIPFSVFVSFFSLFLIGFLAFFPSQTRSDFQWRKPLTGSIFALICSLGMIAVFFPSKCSKIFHENQNKKSSDAVIPTREKFQKSSKIFGLVLTHGHHPECKCFLHHEFKVGEKTFCVACMGLLFGALASFFGTAIYFFSGWTVGENCTLWVVFGVLGVALGLLQYVCFDVRWRLFRFCSNALFIFGMFLLLIVIDAIAQSLLLNFLLISLCVFWLSTRILLSKRIHKRIYRTCKLVVNDKNREC